MSEYERMVSNQRKLMLYLLGILVIGYIITPYSKVFIGLLLGSAISFINMVLLQKQVKSLGEAITGTGSSFSLGTIARIVTVILTIVFALKLKDRIHIGSVVIGLMFSYIFMLIEMFIRAVKEVKKSEKDLNHQLQDTRTESNDIGKA